MNRADWLKEKRRETEERYDTLWAADYSEKWGIYANATHQLFMQKFLNLLSQHSMVLDAACGAGRYWPVILERGHTVFGIDQSQGMLNSAHKKFPDVPIKKIGLQEMDFHETFDAATCMDAMEHIFPEDWLAILNNFHRAIKPNGYFYFTVEIPAMNEVEAAFSAGQQLGLPIVHGEIPEEDDVYHYYPSLQQVRDWLNEAGFHLIEETFGDLYQHFLVQKK